MAELAPGPQAARGKRLTTSKKGSGAGKTLLVLAAKSQLRSLGGSGRLPPSLAHKTRVPAGGGPSCSGQQGHWPRDWPCARRLQLSALCDKGMVAPEERLPTPSQAEPADVLCSFLA